MKHGTLMLILILGYAAFSAIPTADTVTNSIGMKFKRIPAGTFEMGFEGRALTGMALYNDHMALGIYDERPTHSVTISRDFYMGVHEVTNTQFKQFRPDHGKDIPWYDNEYTGPVTRMTWYGADSFCQWLTDNDANGWTYRLPTEAEWEYCCRAGTTTWFSTGDTISSSLANVAIGWGSSATPKPVGSYPANSFGLYDMHGNALEWCLDWYGPYQNNSVTNPAGRDTGDLKCVRGMAQMPFIRTVARGAKPPLTTTQSTSGSVSIRVVISTLTKDSLVLVPKSDSLPAWQRRVAASRPAPSLNISGEDYTDPDGRTFVRTRIDRSRYPSQWDSVFYVSREIIPGDSGASRALAGEYAKALSGRHGILYRVSNRYEEQSADLPTGAGEFRLTILPDVKYEPSGWGHPDAGVYHYRKLPVVDTTWQVGGPLYWDVNHVPWLAEAPNGDLLMTFYSATSEDIPEQVVGVSRLRCNEDSWDSITSSIDIPGGVEWGAFHKNKNGRLFYVTGMFYSRNWMTRYSDDNGATWSGYRPNSGMISAFPMRGDSILGCLWQEFRLSTDAGMTAKDLPIIPDGKGRSFFIDDEGTIRSYNRPHGGGGAINDSGITTMGQDFSSNLGESWTHAYTPFRAPDIGCWSQCIKLQSGRILFATLSPSSPYPTHAILAESEDQGRTWFCRRKFPNDSLRLHLSVVQGKDGLIHLCSSYGSGTGNGDNPQITFSEQWLKDGTCLDMAEWAVTSSRDMIAPCPTVDTMHAWNGANTGVVHKGGANNYSPLRLTAAPNPFNPSVRFTVIPGLKDATLKIYDCTGALTADLSGLLKTNGLVEWDARDHSSGLYVAVLEIPGKRIVRTLVLVK